MITSEEFVASQEARLNEFSTNIDDQPLIVQFAAKSAETLAKASTYLVGHCAGIDINCGCPQKWAIKEGYGGALLKQPELVKEMVRQTKEASGLPCSIKIRVDPKDLNNTVELARRAERVGAEWVTVHGRTIHQASTEAVNFEAVKLVKESVAVPVFGNGNCFAMSDVQEWKEKTGVDGVMAARGLLANPALFAGFETTPVSCVQDFVDLALTVGGISTRCFHQHIAMMLFNVLTREEKAEFHAIKSVPATLEWLETRGLLPSS
jgi:tRNA-dihydrouridine synthase 4